MTPGAVRINNEVMVVRAHFHLVGSEGVQP